ncbi:ABC transporter transmembrane domain-containing protein [Actinomadura chokoriensis]|uniref:ABC transporter transmembrane domain-containing protein n=1 Tax=Actinomadura chokoriensis TaxID=454156 RepID=A0ABV4QY23_9ACTN
MAVLALRGGSGDGRPARRRAVLLALRYYWDVLRRQWRISLPAMTLPALGNICLFYLTPLVVAALVGHLAGGGESDLAALLPYVLGFAGLMLTGEALWRAGLHFLNRTNGRGIEWLGIVGMDELLAKDTAFFHDNFAGSLTKRILSFCGGFENFADTLTFSVVANVIPLSFASVILWRYHPLLVVVLLGLIVFTGFLVAPFIRRRQVLVDDARRPRCGCRATSPTCSPTWRRSARSPPRSGRPPSSAAGSSSSTAWRCAPGTTPTCGSTRSSPRCRS